MKKIPLLDLKQQIASVRPAIDHAMTRVIETTGFVGGQMVADFERDFAAYCEVPFAIGCGNGTDALELALKALGVGRGDRVLTVSHTFIATAEAIVNVGAEPVLVDVDPLTLVMDLGAVEATLARVSDIRAIVPVHLYGNVVPMDRLMALAERHNLAVVEDAAQAHGARFKGKRAGSFGHCATFSFFPGKNLGAFGDAGAVITKDAVLRQRIGAERDHGRQEKYTHDFFGRNSRMDPLQAAVLGAKLPHLEAWNMKRRAVAVRYDELLPSVLGRVQTTRECEPVFHQYVIRHPQRDMLRNRLADAGVDTGVHYPLPLHKQPAWRSQGLPAYALPVTERAAQEVLSLPIFPELTEEQIEHVTRTLRAAL